MDYTILVNKDNALVRSYVPEELVDAGSSYKNNILVNQTLLDNFNLMKMDAYKNGFNIDIMSGYRDYGYQEKIYNRMVLEKGFAYAFRSIAKAGCSEHQTGLAIDICIYRNGLCFIEHELEETDEVKWLVDNCYKYGFILRYPRGMEDRTGYNYEPWHFRYVGRDVAKYLWERKMILEDYINLIK